MLPDQSAIDYTFATAVKALGQNLAGAPEWLLGAWVGLAIALVALARRADRGRRLLLGALAASFPIGYLFWWATAYSGAGARNGLGPHYYVPAFVPLAILLAWGVDDLWRRTSVRTLVPIALAAVVAMVVVVPPKVGANRAVTEHFESIAAAVPPGMDNSVVFLRPGAEDRNYLLTPWPFLENGPGLDDPVIYAIDRGAANERLMQRYPERSPYRLRPEIQPGQGLDAKGRLDPVIVHRTQRLELHVRIANPTWKPAATGFIKLGNQLKLVPLLRFGDESTYEATFFLDAPDSEPSPENEHRTVTFDGTQELAVGVSFSDGQSYGTAEVFERRFPVGLQAAHDDEPAQLVVQSPGTGWHLVDLGHGAQWLPENIDTVLSEQPR